MFLYLARYTGLGTYDDPFRPRGSDQPGWSAIDFRATRADAGYAIVSVPTRDDTIGNYLGDSPDEIAVAVKLAIELRFGLVLEAIRPRLMIAELLMRHGRTDGTRWKPLRPNHLGHYHVFLGGLQPFWSQGPIAGGSTITESFNTADGDILGPDLTWTELAGDLDIVSNRAKSIAVRARARADSDLASADHYAQVECPVLHDNGVLVRKDRTATDTNYLAIIRGDTLNDIRLFRVVNGAFTQLGVTVSITPAAPNSVKGQADGSTIKAFHNGTEEISATDTNITGNLRTGLWSDVGGSEFDNFEAGDLAAAAVTRRQIPQWDWRSPWNWRPCA